MLTAPRPRPLQNSCQERIDGYSASLPATAADVGKSMGLALLKRSMGAFSGNHAHSVRSGIWFVGHAAGDIEYVPGATGFPVATITGSQIYKVRSPGIDAFESGVRTDNVYNLRCEPACVYTFVWEWACRSAQAAAASPLLSNSPPKAQNCQIALALLFFDCAEQSV